MKLVASTVPRRKGNVTVEGESVTSSRRSLQAAGASKISTAQLRIRTKHPDPDSVGAHAAAPAVRGEAAHNEGVNSQREVADQPVMVRESTPTLPPACLVM